MPKQQVKINVKQGALLTDEAFLAAQLEKVNTADVPKSFFPGAIEKVENPTWLARRLDIPYSAWKLLMAANLIRGKHVYDAQGVLSHVNKKGGVIVSNALANARKSGVRAGYSEERMFVKTIIVGKGYSHKKIDIKGRGRQGTIHVPKSNLRIVLEERSPTDFYKMVLKGEASPGLGHVFRKLLY